MSAPGNPHDGGRNLPMSASGDNINLNRLFIRWMPADMSPTIQERSMMDFPTLQAELPAAKDHPRSVSISGPKARMVTRPTL